MSRHAPDIIMRTRIGKTDRETLILRADGHWTVVYDGRPINILNTYYYIDRKKYVNNGFAGQGHAENLAQKLNHQFNTDKFEARKLL